MMDEKMLWHSTRDIPKKTKEEVGQIFSRIHEDIADEEACVNAESDLDKMYKLRMRVDRLDQLIELGAPDRVVAVEMRLVLEAYIDLMGWKD